MLHNKETNGGWTRRYELPRKICHHFLTRDRAKRERLQLLIHLIYTLYIWITFFSFFLHGLTFTFPFPSTSSVSFPFSPSHTSFFPFLYFFSHFFSPHPSPLLSQSILSFSPFFFPHSSSSILSSLLTLNPQPRFPLFNFLTLQSIVRFKCHLNHPVQEAQMALHKMYFPPHVFLLLPFKKIQEKKISLQCQFALPR